MKVSDAGRLFVKAHEGFRSKAYKDSAGVWTLGVGHTLGVHEDDVCTEAQADVWLTEDLGNAEHCLNAVVKVPLTQPQFDALASFVFNLGCARLIGSTLLRKLNEGDYKGASAEFLRWNRAGGKVLQGLVDRRMNEMKLFLTEAE